MKRLQCEMCGSQDLSKEDGYFVCQSCGTKYSVEEAKKMMIEGTVAVEGTVKVDKSDELKNLYILARRAKDSDNADNACRYYTEIEIKDPNSWEAYFYLIYFKARTTKINEITKDCKNLTNCIPTLLDLLTKQVPSVEEQISHLMTISKDISKIGSIMMSSAHGIDFENTIQYTADVLEMMDNIGQKIYDRGEMFYGVAVYLWKAAIDNFVQDYCYGKCDYDSYKFFAKDALAKYDLKGLVEKIYAIDPTYVDPMGFYKKIQQKGNASVPSSVNMSFSEAVSSGFKNYAKFKGEASRSEYWWWVLFYSILYYGFWGISALTDIHFFYILAMIISYVLLIPSIAVAVRRCHDAGKSGWCVLIPIYNLIIMLLPSKD